MGQVIELVEDFGTARLKPGLYVAASDGDAYGPLLALITAGGATLIGEHSDTRGRKRLAARVGTPRNRNAGVDFSKVDPSMLQTVGLGPEYFSKVTDDYSEWKVKWWREAIQNSVDAGATKIKCDLTQNPDGTWTISAEDNGGGMTVEILTTKFLSMGGTTKVGQEGAAGGFGKAKELLLFPWLSWEIHSRDRLARGRGAQYIVEEAPKLRGTKISVVMPADNHTTGYAAIAFISKCYLPKVKFTVNQRSPDDAWDRVVKANLKVTPKMLLETAAGLANIYVLKVDRDTHEMMIRTQGIYMFSEWIGKDVKGKQIIAEITVPSIEVLTSNRDGFRVWRLSQAIRELGARVASDVLSALKLKQGIVRQKYEGQGKFQAQRRQATALAELGPIGPTTKGKLSLETVSVDDIARAAEEISRQAPPGAPIPNKSLATELLTNTVYNGAHHVEEAVRQLIWEPDFFLINEIEGFRIPKKFKPETMAPRISKLVRTWTELCRYVLMQLGTFREYGVGLMFSETSAAQYMREDGEEWLILNPYKDLNERKDTWSPTKKPDLQWLYAAAVHECTHFADGAHDHDEVFAAALTYNIAKTADGFKHVRKIVNSIRMRDEATADVLRLDNPHGPVLTQTDLVGRLKF